MSSFIQPVKKSTLGIKPRFTKPNNIRAMREREERRQATNQASQITTPQPTAARPVMAKSAPLAMSRRQQCPNKDCPKPNVVDGTCQTCGRVADDSNIVAEVQFGETSSGAAIVQGSFIGADQAGARSMGPGFRRVGGGDDREKSIREARSLMQGYAQQLSVGENFVTQGTQVFKLASGANFIQGRTLASVAAVCLYAACRAEPPCKVMLIDLADLVQLNVFKLGRIFKKLNEVVPIGNDGLIPVYPEDLIWRFATKMEFHQDTAKVAEDAVRLVKRMSRDWMVMGRRPSGICGACLLMAARMHNFRRTVREVVYIVKVTNHTIQNRLSEFKYTESSRMSVEDFLKQDFLEGAQDPPSFYQQTDEYKRLMEKSRKRKRITSGEGDGNADPDDVVEVDGDDDSTQASKKSRPDAPSGADLSRAPTVAYRRDGDGFIVPALPKHIAEHAEHTGKSQELDLDDPTTTLEGLVEDYGDEIDGALDADEAEQRGSGAGRQSKPQLPINDEWEEDERRLEEEMGEIFNDPLTIQHAMAYSNAEQRARIHSHWALQQKPQREVSMAAEIDEDEFADDPEVINCLLSPEETKIKETIWVNQNKDWLRQHQEKVFRRKMEADRPKQTRRRRKRARMGEGQTSPANSAAEAAISVAKDRAWSKRINYDAIRSMFDMPNVAGPGSEATSRKTSLAGSVLGTREEEEEAPEESVAGDDYEDEDTFAYDEDGNYRGGDGGEVGEFEGGYDDDPDMDDGYDDE